MPLRNLPLQAIVISLIVPVFAVSFAYQASIRWEGFSSVIKEDWERNFRAGVESGGRVEMGGRTPVYLYVCICLTLMRLVYWGYMD